ncbi:hypothetical protein AAE478_005534 [Parahypoxylon ruwenzoriense]
MLSLLPDLAPRDSHSLWYTSSRNPLSSSSSYASVNFDAYAPHADPNAPSPPHHQQQQHHHATAAAVANAHGPHRRGGGAHLLERSPLARLRADEQNLERRRANVTNFGSAWLKPLGVPKTLHQLREERREAEEHQEALRREQLAQELAEAEAAGLPPHAAGAVDAVLEVPPGEGGAGDDGVMDDVQLDGARDLDEDIPEADEFGAGSDEEEEDEEEDSDDDDDDDDEEEDAERRAARTQQQLMAQRMRQTDDAFRETMARGQDGAAYYGVDDEVDDEDQAQMIEEDDLVTHHGGNGGGGGGGGDGDMDMDADLDDDIPEAEDEGYEHTDSEVEMSGSSSGSSDGDQAEMSFAPAPRARFRSSLARSDATRNSLAISDILSHDGSSMLADSPQMLRRQAGPARRGRG